MKIFLGLFVLLFCLVSKKSSGQYTLRLIVNEVATKGEDDIYVSGSFNNWNARDEKYKLKPYGIKRRAIVLKDIPPGKYEFKFTRGSFDKVETTAKGVDVPNHEVTLNEDASLTFTIAGWKDNYPDKPKPNTASRQVIIVDTAFFIPQLNRKRRIWAYLPKNYTTSKKSYPVIYMHDGQNLFNEQTAPYGEWRVDETLDSLTGKTGKEVIVIGIDNGGDKRMQEYNPYDHKSHGKGEGKQYVDFLAFTLKPFIDKNYRTLKDSAHTTIAGSSMGGLISMYAIARYPHVFGSAGIFSPAFWIAPDIFDEVEKAKFGRGFHRFYFYAGGSEGPLMVPDMDKMIAIVERKGNYETRRIMSPLGKHDEAAWRKEFPAFCEFITK